MMPKTDGRLRMSHSVHIHDSEPVAAEICVFKHAIAARLFAPPDDPLHRQREGEQVVNRHAH